MEKYLYYFKDTYAKGTDNCSFLVYSDVEPKLMEQFEIVADFIWREEPREEISFKNLLNLYDKYAKDYGGVSKVEIIEKIVKDEGFIWEIPQPIVIKW